MGKVCASRWQLSPIETIHQPGIMVNCEPNCLKLYQFSGTGKYTPIRSFEINVFGSCFIAEANL